MDFTIPNIVSLTEGVKDHESLGVLLGIRNPKSRFQKLKQINPEPAQQRTSMFRHWHLTHPMASWSLLYQALQMIGAHGPAEEIRKKYLSG